MKRRRKTRTMSSPAEPADGGVGPAGGPDAAGGVGAGGRVDRAVLAVGTARDRVLGQVVAVLVRIVRLLRWPTLLVAAAPLTPAAVLAVLGVARPDAPLVVVALLGAVPGVWLLVRRAQLLRIAEQPDQVAADLAALSTGRDLWSTVLDNLGGWRDPVLGGGAKSMRLLRTMWHGVRLGTGALEVLTERATIAPLTPARLRGLAVLTVVCLITAVILTIFTAVLLLATAAGL